jgi:LacI family transcriptional regulator
MARAEMKKRPTVIDVAKRAHVGASTVSRFLRGVTVRPDVAERVAKAVESLGYHPDETARALRGGRSRTIGVVLPKVSNVFFSQAVQIMEEEARKRGCAVILFTHQDRSSQQQEHLKALRRYRVDGVIITATTGTTLEEVRAVLPEVPIVAFDNLFSTEIDTVVLRNREAGRIATDHLLRHGYRNVACVTGKPEVYSFKERADGYKDAMTAKRLKPNLLTAPTYEQLRFVLASAVRAKTRPAAILSLSDFATLTILSTFNELGLTAADTIPVIGFDDFGFAPLVNPPLTVIRQPIEQMVMYAMNALFLRIEGESATPGQLVMLAGELICRQSCGCV